MSRKKDMSDNVIILGAGASADAGIPLMGQFMDVMWNIARLGRRSGSVPQKTLEVLEAALEVREELDGFHGRAAFNVWNIEDILSILSFSNQKSLEKMTKAIAAVIEHSCQVTHNGKLTEHTTPNMYGEFWRALIAWAQKHNAPIPPILTFNYDLVLERSLLHSLVGKHYRNQAGFEYDGIEVSYAVQNPIRLQTETGIWRDENFREERGLILQEFDPQTQLDKKKLLQFELLKLHGSVNFPKTQQDKPALQTSSEKLVNSLGDPLILPPVFNKATDSIGKDVWNRALQVLRGCKNLIICGYSLPATDIYMQYFLKAALGPNQDLNRIFVFDPVLFIGESQADGAALRQRYAQNFSSPIQKRIEFSPSFSKGASRPGGMRHLVNTLQNQPESLLFG